jgi:hypothetical protein
LIGHFFNEKKRFVNILSFNDDVKDLICHKERSGCIIEQFSKEVNLQLWKNKRKQSVFYISFVKDISNFIKSCQVMWSFWSI